MSGEAADRLRSGVPPHAEVAVTMASLASVCRRNPGFTAHLRFSGKFHAMNIVATVQALNQRAAKEKWYHYCDPTLAFTDSYYGELLSLWRTKAERGKMPRRSEITPRDLKNVLRNIVMFERVGRDPSRYRWRLIGTNLTHMAGDNTGKMFEETLPAEHMPRWVECCDLVLDGGQPIRFLGRVHLQGKEYLDAENLFVPLANDADEPTFMMGLCRYTPRRSEDDRTWESQIASIPAAFL
jgi:hypothetical protein